MTLARNIGNAINDFVDIRSAIEEKGISISPGTLTNEFAGFIRQIQEAPQWPSFTGEAAALIHAGDFVYGANVAESDAFSHNMQIPGAVDDHGRGVAISPNGKFMAITRLASPYLMLYKIEGETFTKLPNPAVLPNAPAGSVAFSPNSDILAIGLNGGNLVMYYLIDGETFTSKPFASPHNLSGQVYNVAFSPDGKFLAVGHESGQGANIYTIGTDRLSTYSTRVGGTVACMAVTWSPDGQFFAMQYGGGVRIYTYLSTTFTLLTEIQNVGTSLNLRFSKNSQFLGIAASDASAANRFNIIKIAGQTFTNLNIGQTPSGSLNGIDFSIDGALVATAHDYAPYLSIYDFNGTTVTRRTDSAITPPASGRGVAFSPNGKFLAVAHNGAPNLQVYKSTPSSFIAPTSASAILGALTSPAPLVTGAALIGVGQAKGDANAGNQITMDVWIG